MKKTILIFLVIFLKWSTINAQCLSGTFTIGGTTPDYITITSAVSALTTNGVCGAVTFNIRPGTYTEQITIPQITGASSINTITFQSELLDSTSVIVEATGTSSNNFVFKWDGVDFIKLYKIKIKNMNTLYSSLILIQNSSDNNEIRSCILQSPISSAYGMDKFQIITNTNNNENYVICNNQFDGGTCGVYLTGDGTIPALCIVRDNDFQNQYGDALFLQNIKTTTVVNNTIYSILASNDGITLSFCGDSSVVSNNQVTLSGGTGIQIIHHYGSSTKYALVSNNRVSGTGATNGIYLNTSSYVKVYHNTVVVSGAGYCFNVEATDSTDIVKNNIFYQKGSGKVYGATFGGTYDADFNTVYTVGSIFGNFDAVDYATFNDWKNNTPNDSNSARVIPKFVSATNFHVLSDFAANITLPYFPEVSKDIEGTVRDVSSPYFGAYEYFNSITSRDASATQLIYPLTQTCPGTQPIKILLKNFGSDTLKSVKVNWSVDGVLKTPFNWVGNLLHGDTIPVTIANMNFANLGSYVIKAWTTNPNSLADPVVFNDTIAPVKVYTRSVGSYTVGGASPNFIDLGVALVSIGKSGVCGNVILNLRPGTYTSSITMYSIDGLSGSNTLTIKSSNGDNTSVINNASLDLQGLDNIVIRNITMGPLSIGTGASNIQVNNCILNGDIAAFVNMGSISDIRILNNTFNTSTFTGNRPIEFNNGSPTSKYYNLKINNNIFNSPADGELYFDQVDTLEFLNNTITGTAGLTTSFYTVNYGLITKNKFYSKNNIGIKLVEWSNSTIANNMITCAGTSSISCALLSDCRDVNFINNSIYCSNTNSATKALNVNTLNSFYKGNTIWNNIVMNTGPGYLVYGTLSFPVSFRNNVYYGNGLNFGNYSGTNVAHLNAWKTIAVSDTGSFVVNPLFNSSTDLHVHEITLKNAGTSVSSYIVDDFDGQLRNSLTPDIGADEFTPDTLDAATNGFSFEKIICSGMVPIEVYFKNNGTTTITSVKINCKINADSLPEYNWSGNLTPKSQTLVNLGNYNFLPGTAYSIRAGTKEPNGDSTDTYIINDSTKKTYTLPGLSGIYTIGGTSPDFSSIGNAVYALKNGGMCGPVVFNIRDGIYTEQIKIPNIKGNSALNTIVFQSEHQDSSLVTIQYSATLTAFDYVASVDTTDYVTFYKLGLKSLGTTYASVLTFNLTAKHCAVKNCWIRSTSLTKGTLLNIQTNSDSCLVEKNRFSNAIIGINISGNYERVLNNYFETQSQYGIKGVGLNTLYSLNTFNYPASFTGVAINMSGVSGGSITKNKFILNGTGQKGIYLNGCGTAANPFYVSNNFISITGGIGIHLSNTQYVNLLFNSVNQQGNGTCVSMYTTTATLNQGNVYRNSYNGNYCAFFNSGNATCKSQYNCIYSSFNMLFNVNGTIYNSLLSYNTATAKDSNSISADPLFVSNTDLHVSEVQLKNAALFNANVIDDIDGNMRNAVPDIGADEFSTVLVGVWPGDADNNKAANNYDLLPIGLYYNQTGPSRASVSNLWQSYVATNWGTLQSGGADIKHADCNGDGIIDDNDTLAVNLNFSSTHTINGPSLNERTNPSLYFFTSSSNYLPGDWVDVDVITGTSLIPVNNLYGIGFNIGYDASLVQPGTESLTYPVSWFAMPGTNAIKIAKINASVNTAHGAETRIDHTNAYGYGKIASLRFKIKTSIYSVTPMNFSILSYAANDSIGNKIFFNNQAYSFNIVPLSTTVNEVNNDNKVYIYPNPYLENTTIYYTLTGKSKVSVEVYNSIGQSMESLVNEVQIAGEYKYNFSAKEKGYNSGVYFVKIAVDGAVTMRRIIEMK